MKRSALDESVSRGIVLVLLPLRVLVLAGTSAAAEDGKARGADEARGVLELRVVESKSASAGGFLPCRVHLEGASGAPVQAPGLPFFRDHFDCEGTVDVKLVPGEYRYTVARGPEYREVSGAVKVAAGERTRLEIELPRWIDLAARGWWSGETHYHRPLEHTALLLRSSDLHVVPVLTESTGSTSGWSGSGAAPLPGGPRTGSGKRKRWTRFSPPIARPAGSSRPFSRKAARGGRRPESRRESPANVERCPFPRYDAGAFGSVVPVLRKFRENSPQGDDT